VAIRPLDVKELAEVLAVDFDDAEGIPKLKPNWRWEDEEQAILTSCSSLITTVKTENIRVVQFSHFSVKEFLTSERLATSSVDVSRYYIDLEPAHTILAQACMSVLLLPEYSDRVEENGIGKRSPLAGYAARHWVTHAQFESVSSSLRTAMEFFFDLDKPCFLTWLESYGINTPPNSHTSSLYLFAVRTKSGATPLYYAALCGFQDLVEHLAVTYPQHVNTSGGYYVTPLFAALAGRHFQTAKLLLQNGAHVNVRGQYGRTPLSSAAWFGDLEVVQVLLDYKADANLNAPGASEWTPMHCLSEGFYSSATLHNVPQSLPDVARLLLEHGADVNARNRSSWTPLHVAAKNGRVEVAHVLLKHGADVNARRNDGSTPLHVAANWRKVAVVRVLLEHGANVGAEDDKGRTPFRIASAEGSDEIMKLLSEHGAEGVS
jgi:ankyrin repeat protein